MPPDHPFVQPSVAGLAHLRILATSDLHTHVAPFDYYADRACETVGLARTATLITAARSEAANCLLVDNGDMLQGNPLADLVARQGLGRAGQMHPVFAAMNALGYDAATLGNHEFNYGLDFLMATLQGAAFPVVSANLSLRRGADPRRDRPLVPPYVLLDRDLADGCGTRHPIRIGLIGFCPPQVVDWDRLHLDGRVQARDILEAATAWVPELLEAGADIVLALSHSGIGAAQASDGMENASTPLARLPGIDALVTGHAHLVFPSPGFASLPGVDAARGRLFGKPAVMPGFYGSHLGVIDLALQREAGAWRVLDSISEARPIWRADAAGRPQALVSSHAPVLAAIAADHEATRVWARGSIGRTDVALHSFFALVSDAPATRLVAAAQARHIAAALQGTVHADLPVLSAVAPFKTGGRGGAQNYTDVAPGVLALRHAADLYVYPNTIAALRLTGAEVIDWLERAAGQFNQIAPGAQDAPLINPDFPSFNLDLISGLSYAIDLAQPSRFDLRGQLANPAAHRIRDATFQGAALDPAAVFAVATNSYRIGGNGGFAGARPDRLIHSGTETILSVLTAHIAAVGTVRALPPPAWHFVAQPGTTVTFTTAERARAHLADIACLHATPVPGADPGCLRLRLRL